MLAITTFATAAHGQFDMTDDTPSTPAPAWQQFKLNPKARVKLDFRNANLDAILHLLSQSSGIAIIKDPTLTGGFTLQSPKAQDLDDAFGMLNAALGLRNYQMVKQGNFLLIQPKPQGGGGRRGGLGFPGGGFTGGTGGRGGANSSQSVLKVYKLQYASSTQVAKVINDVFANVTADALQTALAQTGFPGFPGGGFPGGGFPAAGVQGGNNNTGGGGRGGRGGGGNGGGRGGASNQSVVKASAEEYSNSVIVNAPSRQQEQIDTIIGQIDKPTVSAQQARVYKLQYAAAADLQTVIQNVLANSATQGRGSTTSTTQNNNNRGGFGGFGGFGGRFGGGNNRNGNNSTSNGTVVADTRSNSLIVTSTTDTLNTVAQVVRQLDKPVRYSSTTFVYTLKNARADIVATLMNNAFGNRLGGSTTNPGGSVTGTTISQGLASSSGTGSALSLTTNNNNRTTQTNNTSRTASADTQITAGKDSYGRIVNVRDLTGQITTVADIDRNSVIVVTAPENWPLIKNTLDELDRVPKQVMIEALVVEATLDDTNKLGVEWNLPFLHGVGSQQFGLKGANADTDPTNPDGFKYSLTSGQYSVFVKAINSSTKFTVLSTPRIFTTNNASAQINVSESIPYVTSTITDINGGSTSSYAYLDVGIVLTVTPRITSNGYVTMDVTQTANDLLGITALNAPDVAKREAQTTVSVKNGETVVLGGIMNTSLSSTVNKVPVLGDLPLLGTLFRSKSKEKKKTELLVFLTPRVVANPEEARKLRADSLKDLEKKTLETIPANINTSVTILDKNTPAGAAGPPTPTPPDVDTEKPPINGEIPTYLMAPDGSPVEAPDNAPAGPDNGDAMPNNQGGAPAGGANGNGNGGMDGGAPGDGGGPPDGGGGPGGGGPGGDGGGPGGGGPGGGGPGE